MSQPLEEEYIQRIQLKDDSTIHFDGLESDQRISLYDTVKRKKPQFSHSTGKKHKANGNKRKKTKKKWQKEEKLKHLCVAVSSS